MAETGPKNGKPRVSPAKPPATAEAGESGPPRSARAKDARSRFSAALEEARAEAAMLGAEARDRAEGVSRQVSTKSDDRLGETQGSVDVYSGRAPFNDAAMRQELVSLRVSLVSQREAYFERDLVVMAWSLLVAFGTLVFAAAEPLGLTELLSSDLLNWMVGVIGAACLVTVGAMLQQFWLSRDRVASIRRRAELERRLEQLNTLS